jgi:hypothetical protein
MTKRRYVLLTGVVILVVVVGVTITFAIQDRNDRVLSDEIARRGTDLQGLGAQITSIRDADLKSMNDYISAYAQIEPMQKEYDQKLQQFSDLFRLAQERDSQRGFFNVRRFYSRHHPEVWENMSEIVTLVRQINDVTKREESVIHAMASLPEPDRLRFWHEQFTPLASEEHALRERLLEAGKSRSSEFGVQ